MTPVGPGGPMRVGIVTLFPEPVAAASGFGVLGRALDRGLAELTLVDPRAYAEDRHRTVDDRPYGGGPGMVMMPQPLFKAIDAVRLELEGPEAGSPGAAAEVVYLSPAGQRLDQRLVGELKDTACARGLVLVAGRYEGIDERVVACMDREVSIGDYVLSGGELPALVVLDAMARLLPGALGNSASAVEESHLDGLLDYPHYTRPEFHPIGGQVPAVLLGGDHAAIRRWRRKEALKRSWLRRPDLLAARELGDEERALLKEGLEELRAELETNLRPGRETRAPGQE